MLCLNKKIKKKFRENKTFNAKYFEFSETFQIFTLSLWVEA